MRRNYPLSSQEFNDIIVNAYGDLCYLLGYTDSGNNRYSGVFEAIEESGLAYLATSSGVPHIGNVDSKYQLGLSPNATSDMLIHYLKFDYVYRKDRRYI